MSSIVSPQWLQEQLDNPCQDPQHPQIVIVDCRFDLANPDKGAQQYALAHLPQAHYFHLDRDLSSPVQRHGGRHPLPDPQELAEKLAAIGIVQGETLVVAYDDSRFAFAARLWWLLRYLGHDRVALLDGGFSAWQRLGYPLTPELPQPQPGQFVPHLQEQQVVNREIVKARKDQGGIVLVDSREPERYRGEYEPIDPIAGHIPGAINAFWKAVTQEDGTIQPLDWHQNHWSTLNPSEEIWVYCGSGVTACVNLLSLHLAGFSNAKLYGGSWSDWCSYLV